MRILLSPAKKMRSDDSIGIGCADLPVFLEDAEKILAWLQTKTFPELKKLWACSDRITEQNMERLSVMKLRGSHPDSAAGLTPAILSYDGIAFQYMAPAVFETEMLTYIQEHLRILSGFYGVLRPLDGVTPYRLEMQAKAGIGGARDLYEYWGDRLYEQVRDESGIIVNLASKEYSRCIDRYRKDGDRFITCTFGEEDHGRIVQKGVYCKMARGEMVRFMAERRIEDPEDMKSFDVLGYQYRDDLSSETEYVFLRA